ncbi:MAG: aldose 1-epimerase family protein [Solirubrobacteraceae bacterium]
MASPPSGAQFEISSGAQRATIVEVGGGIRAYSVSGRDVLEPYDIEQMCDGAHGAVLIPWPNRVGDGRYSFDGSEHQLDLSEPVRHNAIHGLLRWVPWRALEHDADRLVMGTRLHPRPGYPFDLDVTVEYQLGAPGLTVATTARNLGALSCPYGAGQHPYLSPGSAPLDDCVLQLQAGTLIVTDPDRGLPCGSSPVQGGPLDFATPRRLGEVQIDDPFTDLRRDGEGRARARLTAPDGSCVELWVDQRHTVLQVFTGDTLTPERRRSGLAVEPMTCPPDAFRSGQDLIRLGPGETVRSVWGVALAG